jgi:glycogen debranching enzyme
LLIESDIKPGEVVIQDKEIFEANDPIFDASTRPSLDEAIKMIIGVQGGFEIPFAAVPLQRHANLEEQNLYRCLFGRDALLIADLLRNHRPRLRLNVVLALADVQGTQFDPSSEEEPGRIAHEVRSDDDVRAMELMAGANWKFPYFGAVDATLIWLRILRDLAREDAKILDVEIQGNRLWEHAAEATSWILRRLGTPSGLIESARSNQNGITNQVWKDSGDSYMHSDGTLARGDSTASIETVGETYDALLAASEILDLRPGVLWPTDSATLKERARGVQVRLIDLMWLEDHFALGTERDKKGLQRPLDSQASNQGRLLDSLILTDEKFAKHREAIVRAVTGPDLLGESGLRTLSTQHPAYRPGGYHTGSAWPMDGVFVARGLVRHGYIEEATLLASRTKRAIESFGGYPEFFRGDWPAHGLITTSVVDIVQESGDTKDHRNRICQPPQIIQGWTVGAYAWLDEFTS